jgi:hypothetical protein
MGKYHILKYGVKLYSLNEFSYILIPTYEKAHFSLFFPVTISECGHYG